MAPEAKNSQAFNKYLEATYVQTGFDGYRRDLEKKYIPAQITYYGGYAAIVLKIYRDRTIKLAWTF